MSQPNQARIVLRDPALAIANEIQKVAGLDSPSAAIALTLTTYGPALLHFLRNPLSAATESTSLALPNLDASLPTTTATDAFEAL